MSRILSEPPQFRLAGASWIAPWTLGTSAMCPNSDPTARADCLRCDMTWVVVGDEGIAAYRGVRYGCQRCQKHTDRPSLRPPPSLRNLATQIGVNTQAIVVLPILSSATRSRHWLEGCHSGDPVPFLSSSRGQSSRGSVG